MRFRDWLRRFGDALPGRRRFVVIMCRPGVGMFASFLQVLGELHWCERSNRVPVVFFGSNWAYWTEGGHAEAINGWEYYFEPVSRHSLLDVVGKNDAYLERCNVFDFQADRIVANENPRHRYDTSRAGHIPLPARVTVVNRWPRFHFGTNRLIEERRARARSLIDRYIVVREEIRERVDRFVAKNFSGHRVVGVHVRGLEHGDEIEGWHGLACASESHYFREVDVHLEVHPEALVFLATDSVATVESFRRRYGARLRVYPSRRSTGGSAPHVQFGGFEVGLEVLIEGLLLARTDHLVHGISNVAFAALCFSPDLEHTDIYEKYEVELREKLRLRESGAAGAVDRA